MSLETWHHVAGVYDDGDLSLYIDGELQGTGTGTEVGAAYTGYDIGIGGDPYYPEDYPWSGLIGPVRISSSVRYSGTFTPTWGWSADADTMALWNVDEGSGSWLYDASGGGHDGEILDATWSEVGCPAE